MKKAHRICRSGKFENSKTRRKDPSLCLFMLSFLKVNDLPEKVRVKGSGKF